jgi:hypothetical protein
VIVSGEVTGSLRSSRMPSFFAITPKSERTRPTNFRESMLGIYDAFSWFDAVTGYQTKERTQPKRQRQRATQQ